MAPVSTPVDRELHDKPILEGFVDALDLQSVTMVVHDVGGPFGFLIATRRPQRFRALVIRTGSPRSSPTRRLRE